MFGSHITKSISLTIEAQSVVMVVLQICVCVCVCVSRCVFLYVGEDKWQVPALQGQVDADKLRTHVKGKRGKKRKDAQE